jgi:copper transport protein
VIWQRGRRSANPRKHVLSRPWVVWSVGLVLLVLLLPAIASAHAELVTSEPAADAVLARPPERVRLSFSEPIEPDFFTLEVYAANQTRVDRNDARVPPDNVASLEVTLSDLRPGAYTVVWRVLSIDGHVVRGTFSFSVGTLPAETPVVQIAVEGAPFAFGATVRWWTYLLAFVLVGGFGFLPLVLSPALRAASISDPTPERRAGRIFVWIAWPAVVLLLLASFLALLIQAADATGVPLQDVFQDRAITRLLGGTKYGTLWLVREGLLLGLLAAVAVMTAQDRPTRWIRWLGLVLGAGLLLTIAASGHASAVARRSIIAIAADWVHLLAGAVWVGGLVQLVLALGPALVVLDAATQRSVLASAIRRFSALAGLSVALLVGTGLYAGLVHVPGWQALLDSSYGAALSGKLMLVVPLLVLGAINLLILHPRFVHAARAKADAQEDAARFGLFQIVVRGEVVLAILVLAVTAILAGLPPATTTPGEGKTFAETRTVGDLTLTLQLTPNRAGDNELTVELADLAGVPVAAPQVAVALHHLDMEMGQRQIAPEQTTPGRYAASGNFLSMGGRWQADVTVQRTGTTAVSTSFAVTVGQPVGTLPPSFSPARILLNANIQATIVGYGALVLGVMLFVQRTRWKRRIDRRRGSIMGTALLLLGLIVTGRTLTTAYRASLPNPVPATEASIARGRQIYTPNCASCHGLTGRGDGPAGVRLNPRPADFRVHMADGHTDAQLFDWVTHGVSGTGMPPFEEQLSREEIWHVINYIRSFAPATQQGTR